MDNVKNRVNEITEQLEQGLKKLFESKKYMEYLNTMSKFHDYSFNNILLIHMQKPDASLVHGYKAWKDDFGRQVMGGEHAIKILAPAPYKKKVQQNKINPETGKIELDGNGIPIKETVEIKIPHFRVVNVFDISQTEGKELPTIGVDELTGDVEQYNIFFKATELAAPVPVGFEKIENGSKGYYSQTDKRIAINEGMSELQNFKTLIHEIAHAKLHDIDLNAPSEKQADRPDRRIREVQAESIAYAVCQHYGLNTSDYSFSYVAQWSSGRELAELKASLETIRSTASELIKDIDKNFAELTKDKEQVQAQETPENETTPEKKQTVLSAPERKTVYYIINEGAARRANNANSYYKYEPGSATAEYRQMVDKAMEIGEQQKKRVDPMYHEKIDSLVNTYARKLAENMNNRFTIEASVPSILIAGGSNFPVHKKEKQNAARDRNMEEWNDVQGLLDKIRSTGMGGISADDPQAVQKLEAKLEKLQSAQDTMKAVNAYYREHKTLDGCPNLSAESIEKMKAEMSSQWHIDDKPFSSWALSNNNAEIRRVKGRIEELTKKQETAYAGWKFDGGKVEANREDNRLQIFFDEKPDEKTRETLKENGFRWSPKAGAWQRQLNDNAIYVADRIKCIQPLTGERPTELQKQVRQENQKASEPGFVYKVRHNPYSTSKEESHFLQVYLTQEKGPAKLGDILYRGTPEKCRELMGKLFAGELTQEQVKEIGRKPSVLKNLNEKKKLLDDGSKQQSRTHSREEIR